MIALADRNDIKINSAKIFITESPCYNCIKLIANTGIKTIHYRKFYRDNQTIEHSKEANINLIDMSD